MPSSEPIQSVVRAVSLLELIAGSPGGLGVGQLSDRLGLNATTVHNLVRTLAGLGCVERRTGPVRYVLGPSLGAMLAKGEQAALTARLERAMLRMTRAVPESTAVWSIVQGGEVRVRLRCVAGRTGLEHPSAQTLGPYTSASALAMLAFGDAEAAASLRRRYPFSEYGAQHWKSAEALDEFLNDARDTGFVVMPHNGEALTRAAHPVYGQGGELCGVLGLSCPSHPDHPDRSDRVAGTLREAVASLDDAGP